MATRLQTIDILQNRDGKRYRKNVIYPEIPVRENDTYVITTGGDRYDLLAQQFYSDSSLWWVIASANTSKRDSLVVKQGVQLRIPESPTEAITLFEEVNSKR